MIRFTSIVAGLWLAGGWSLSAAEVQLNVTGLQPGDSLPEAFRPALSGEGPPSQWVIVEDEAPSEFSRITSLAAQSNILPVIAEISGDKTDERFPLLIYEEQTFQDFKLVTQFKLAGGETEQMAGIAFRIQDENNYFVVRASGLGDTFMFYSFVDGQRTPPVGNRLEIATNVWHTLEIECRGPEFRFFLNGEPAMPPVNNPRFQEGKIGFWTKSDSRVHFASTRITYVPKVPLAQRLVNQVLEQYDRLLGFKILVPNEEGNAMKILASDQGEEVGQLGYADEIKVLNTDKFFVWKQKDDVTVTLPVKDRNGEKVAAVRVVMETFRGQTDQNAIVRAQPIRELVQGQVLDLSDLTGK